MITSYFGYPGPPVFKEHCSSALIERPHCAPVPYRGFPVCASLRAPGTEPCRATGGYIDDKATFICFSNSTLFPERQHIQRPTCVCVCVCNFCDSVARPAVVPPGRSHSGYFWIWSKVKKEKIIVPLILCTNSL